MQPADTSAAAPGVVGQDAAAAGSGQGDALDKGLSKIAEKLGHKQSNANIEKASDGIRKLFKKITGKDVPIKDQDFK